METHFLCELLSVVTEIPACLPSLGNHPTTGPKQPREWNKTCIYTYVMDGLKQHKSHFKPAVATPVLK